MPLTAYRARLARLDALEARYTARLRVALLRGAEAALLAVEHGASATVAAALVSDKYLKPVLTALYVDCGTAEAQIEYEQLTANIKAFPGLGLVQSWGQRLSQYIATEGAAAVRGITDTTRGIVKRVLNDAAQAGSSIPATVKALREKLTELAPKRARTIARTELISASSYGSLMGAQATGLALNKYWISTPGGRTRPTHARANGQTVALNALFSVGGQPARYPGDAMLSAGERANCRCSIGYKPI